MIVNSTDLILRRPLYGMNKTKEKKYGVSHGMSEAGYDITLAEHISFHPGVPLSLKFWNYCSPTITRWKKNAEWKDPIIYGNFCLASANEEFCMPDNLVGVVHDKSTWARRGLSVFNTVIEPGWKGFLTLELVFHGSEPLVIAAGQGIAQVIFHETTRPANYAGKYQFQSAGPTEAKSS